MINVSSWSIKNPIPSVMIFVLLTLAAVVPVDEGAKLSRSRFANGYGGGIAARRGTGATRK